MFKCIMVKVGKPKNRKRTKIWRKFINFAEIVGEKYEIGVICLGGMDVPEIYDVLHSLKMDPDRFYASESMSVAIANVRCFSPMHTKMLLQMWSSAKVLPTFTACIRSFPGVSSHVKN